MRGNELIPDPAWGSTPELGLTVSEQSRGFAHAEQWVALWAVRLVGKRWHEGSLLRQGLLPVTPSHPFRTAPLGCCDGEQQAWAKEGRGCTQDKKHSKYQGPLFFPLHPWLLQGESQALGAGGRGKEQRKSQK